MCLCPNNGTNNPHQKDGQTIPPKGMRLADHALTAAQWPIFTSHSAGAESFSPRITGSKADNLRPLLLSFFLDRTSFIMEVLCTQMCATASLCLGRGGYLMSNSFHLAMLCLFLASYPIADPPGRQFLFHSGLWVTGRELLRMELEGRKSAVRLLCSSSFSF